MVIEKLTARMLYTYIVFHTKRCLIPLPYPQKYKTVDKPVSSGDKRHQSQVKMTYCYHGVYDIKVLYNIAIIAFHDLLIKYIQDIRFT